MEDIMTDLQFKKIIEMISMILDGCKDLNEAKKKIADLQKDNHEEEKQN